MQRKKKMKEEYPNLFPHIKFKKAPCDFCGKKTGNRTRSMLPVCDDCSYKKGICIEYFEDRVLQNKQNDKPPPGVYEAEEAYKRR